MLYLGIDVGTTAVKAAAFDREGGRIAEAAMKAETISPRPGWFEQDMEQVWRTVRGAVLAVVKDVDGDDIASVGVAGQGDGLWALDAELKPVRNAILWNDQRAVAIVQRWIDTGVSDALAETCRTAIWPGTSAAAYCWLREEEPETAARIAHICNAKDWIGHRLTGALATDFTDAAIPFLDLDARSYSDRTFEICGAPELREKTLAPRPSADRLGELTAHAAEELGLNPGTPVAVGALDLAAMHVGAGLNQIGGALLILGTTAVVSTVVEPSPARAKPVGATVFHPMGDRWLNAQAPQSGASALDWLADRHPATWPGGAVDAIVSAKEAPPGSNGVIFLPYLTGERAPFVAPEATGAFLGLRATTTTAELARAVLEGVAFSLRHCVEATGISSKTGFVVSGGGGRSPLWRQILADTLGASVRSAGEDDFGPRGAAFLGAGAAGLREPYAAAPQKNTSSCHEPDGEISRVYDAAYQDYRASLDALRPTWRK